MRISKYMYLIIRRRVLRRMDGLRVIAANRHRLVISPFVSRPTDDVGLDGPSTGPRLPSNRLRSIQPTRTESSTAIPGNCMIVHARPSTNHYFGRSVRRESSVGNKTPLT